jgi:hypothetical protein
LVVWNPFHEKRKFEGQEILGKGKETDVPFIIPKHEP